jgi:hypothetical protein
MVLNNHSDNKLRERQKKILIVTKRLIIFSAVSVLIVAIIFSISFISLEKFPVSPFCFACGIIGGFVSIQQRLRKIDDSELDLLAQSWATILLIPLYGGIFALILYVLFLSGLLKGDLFPNFYIPPFNDVPSKADFIKFLGETFPKTPADFAKFTFWSFVAGFSERYVPQIIKSVASTAAGSSEKDETDAKS